jgi:hypothetical protein
MSGQFPLDPPRDEDREPRQSIFAERRPPLERVRQAGLKLATVGGVLRSGLTAEFEAAVEEAERELINATSAIRAVQDEKEAAEARAAAAEQALGQLREKALDLCANDTPTFYSTRWYELTHALLPYGNEGLPAEAIRERLRESLAAQRQERLKTVEDEIQAESMGIGPSYERQEPR